MQGAFKKFSEWSPKIKERRDTNKIPSSGFTIGNDFTRYAKHNAENITEINISKFILKKSRKLSTRISSLLPHIDIIFSETCL